MKKVKTYVLTVSKTFPKTHKRSGEPTLFPEKLLNTSKIHTIRSNYELWRKRIDEVNAGLAILSIRNWSAKPYNSKQEIICELDKNSGIGIQQLSFNSQLLSKSYISGGTASNAFGWDKFVSNQILSENDGLTLSDFMEWFKNYDLSEPMAIIHFTPFRY